MNESKRKQPPIFKSPPRYSDVNLKESDSNKILSILYTNRSFTHFYLNNYRQAVIDATNALYADIKNPNAFVARSKATIKMENYSYAYDDLTEALKLDSNSKRISKLLKKVQTIISQQETIQEIKQADYSIQNYEYFPYQKISSKTFNFESLTKDDTIEICSILSKFELLNKDNVIQLLQLIINKLALLPNIVNINNAQEIIVVGDTHGQFQDLMNIFKLYGYPSKERPYLINGDFVDRGSQGLEILISIFAWKLYDDSCIYINRGNHETYMMNYVYGFYKECEKKLGLEVAEACRCVFQYLPLAHIINNKVFVVHGGICPDPQMDMNYMQSIKRAEEQPEDGLMNYLLWSDPKDENGTSESIRGGTTMFGPDITERFLKDNHLELVIRSHEFIQEGYKIQHDGKCITVFSAPNYVGKMNNKGAIAHVCFDTNGNLLPLKFDLFDAKPIPFDFQPMIYANMDVFNEQ